MDIYKLFTYVYYMPPIDFWDGALVPSMEEEERVLRQMPEKPRDRHVYKLYIPYSGDCKLIPILLCKADNNGTIYIFSDHPIKDAFSDLYLEFINN